MPFEDLLKTIDTIEYPAPDFTVVFTGGEPLIRNDIELCGREIRKRGLKWSLVSNGHLYTKERHISLLNAGLGALTISLDGLETSHNWLRNSKTSFNKVINAIELAANSKRLNFDVVTCVNQKNISELKQIRELLIAKKVKSWRLFTIVPIGRAIHNSDLLLTDNQFLKLMEFISIFRKVKELKVQFSCEGYTGRYESKVRDSYFFCRAGINIGSVLIDGSISACPNIDRSFSQGNIFTDNFYKIWQSKFEPFRNRNWMKKGQCESCKEFKNCQGNGFHNWHGEKQNVLVCHHQKIERALKYIHALLRQEN
jgi:radical SAM enzyme (rSAM/lipoprotein system)